MNKKLRTILFAVCLFLFLSITPLIVFYSQGYRIDWDSKKIIKTGGFYFKVWPKDVQVFVDGKFKKKTGFLTNSVYVSDLTPKEYRVEITKPRFQTWQKSLEIKENLVTESGSIILFPEDPNYTNLEQKVESFFISPDQRKIILKDVKEKVWSLKIIELDINTTGKLFSGFQSAEVTLLDLQFSQDSNRILLTTKEKEVTKHWILELQSPIQEKNPTDLVPLDFLGDNIGRISFNPDDPQKIFFLKENSLFSANIATKKVNLSPMIEKIISYEISDKNLVWLSSDGFIFRANLMAGNIEKLNSESFSVKEGKKYQIYVKFPLLFLQEDKTLYILKPSSNVLEKFSEFVAYIKFSPDNKKMLYSNDYEISLLFLEKKENQPQKETLEKVFLTRFSDKIDIIYWLNSDYLVFNTGTKIKISEIDDRDKFNIYDFDEFKSPEIFFNQFDKKLYILSEGKLFSSIELIP